MSEVVNLQLIGSDMATPEQGTHELKGVPNDERPFAFEGRRRKAARAVATPAISFELGERQNG